MRKSVPTQEMLVKIGSMELFIKCFYELTGLDSDMEFISDFLKNYDEFCSLYRIDK